jgi:hypothetical protein
MGNVNSPEPKEHKLKESNKGTTADDMKNSMKGFSKSDLGEGVSKEPMNGTGPTVRGWFGV